MDERVPGRPGDRDQVDLPGPDWAWRIRLHQWRERVRANPASHATYRTAIAVVGAVVVVVGLVMVPLPGPGWLVVFLGVGIWATEFHWARRLLAFGRRVLDRWVSWLAHQGWGTRGLVALGCWLVVVAMFWVLFRLAGVPAWLPQLAQDALHQYAHL